MNSQEARIQNNYESSISVRTQKNLRVNWPPLPLNGKREAGREIGNTNMVDGTYNNSVFKNRRKELRANQSEAEKILWEHIRGRKLEKCKFWRQYSVGPYILDFYCPQIRLAVEVDGDQHQEAIEYDQERERYLVDLDIKTIRYRNAEIMYNIKKVVEDIRKHTLLPLSGKREVGREIV